VTVAGKLGGEGFGKSPNFSGGYEVGVVESGGTVNCYLTVDYVSHLLYINQSLRVIKPNLLCR
jgi:hypothetical protein